MLGEQYGGLIISTAITAGLIIPLYPHFIQSLIFIVVLIWAIAFKLVKWAERNKIDGYISSLFASISAIYGVYYLSKDSIGFIMVGFIYLVITIFTMKSVIEGTANEVVQTH